MRGYRWISLAAACGATFVAAGCGSMSATGDHAHLVGRGPRSVVLAGQTATLPGPIAVRNDDEMGNISPAYARGGIVLRRTSDRQLNVDGRLHDHYNSRTLIFEYEGR